eukprot:TRINITY_DN25158_c0_g1_i2.p1 TRINITY_DN25158_c0_g1~~TRINITY_DN25158_c0_g1_i2.p1  ORF type:complete len:225 (+),score=17.57 TRINITY_DN25158_c0_g1_i2:49-675(+)
MGFETQNKTETTVSKEIRSCSVSLALSFRRGRAVLRPSLSEAALPDGEVPAGIVDSEFLDEVGRQVATVLGSGTSSVGVPDANIVLMPYIVLGYRCPVVFDTLLPEVRARLPSLKHYITSELLWGSTLMDLGEDLVQALLRRVDGYLQQDTLVEYQQNFLSVVYHALNNHSVARDSPLYSRLLRVAARRSNLTEEDLRQSSGTPSYWR